MNAPRDPVAVTAGRDDRPTPEGGIVVFGNGGHAAALIDVLQRAGVEVAVVVDPAAVRHPDVGHPDVPVLDNDDAGVRFARKNGRHALVAIGDNRRRLDLLQILSLAGVPAATLVAASATVSVDCVLGSGTVVFEHAHVGPAAALGVGCIVNTGAIVEHGAWLGDGVHVGPGAVVAGAGRCGTRALIGAGATLLPNLVVGDDAVVAAGAVVTCTVEPMAVVAGVPARPVSGKS